MIICGWSLTVEGWGLISEERLYANSTHYNITMHVLFMFGVFIETAETQITTNDEKKVSFAQYVSVNFNFIVFL